MNSFVYGYPACYESGQWKWLDNKKEITDPIDRPCPKCKMVITTLGHDPCIANLKGVEFACCGHGSMPGYVKLFDGKKFFLNEYLRRNR